MANKNQGSGSTGTSGNKPGGIGYFPEDKWNISPLEARERYGVEAHPIPADEAYRAPIPNFSKKDVRAEKWILVNYKANGGKGTMTFVNTFDGMAGSNFKQDVATFPLDPKKLRDKIKEFEKVPVEECPVCVSSQEAQEHEIAPPSGQSMVGGAK